MRYEFVPVEGLVRVYFTAPANYNAELIDEYFPGRFAFKVGDQWCGIQCSFEEWDNWMAMVLTELARGVQRSPALQSQVTEMGLELARFHDWCEEVSRTIFFKPPELQA